MFQLTIINNLFQLTIIIISGWGVMTLDDIPKGSFICTYNGLICNDETGDTRGLLNGDEYLIELDYIG